MEKMKNVQNMELNHSNMLNESEHDLRSTTTKGFLKKNSPDKLIKLEDGGDNIICELKGSMSKAKLHSSDQVLSSLQ